MAFKNSLFIFLLGAAVGICLPLLFRSFNGSDAHDDVKRDTVTVYKTVSYSRLELAANTIRLDVPELASPEYVFVLEDSTSIIYRDSIRYVTAPRQFFYTRTNDAEIFHSGIDSRIDSLNVFMKNTSITHVVTPKEKKHSIGIGIEANYATALSMPIQLEYSYMVKPSMSLYGYAEYEPFRRQIGVGLGTRFTFEW